MKRRVGYLPEGAPLYEDMTTSSFLSFAAATRGMRGAARRGAVDAAVDRLQLDEVYNQRVGTLSKGFKRRVGLAQAIMHDPEVLILDEPTDGLDPNQKHQVRELIRRMSADKAVVISTHILEEVDAVCTRAIVIARGRMVADDSPLRLEQRSAYWNAVSMRMPPDRVPAVREALEGLEGASRIEVDEKPSGSAQVVVVPQAGAALADAVGERLRQRNVAVEDFRTERGRLEDVFREITVGEAAR